MSCNGIKIMYDFGNNLSDCWVVYVKEKVCSFEGVDSRFFFNVEKFILLFVYWILLISIIFEVYRKWLEYDGVWGLFVKLRY